MGGDPQRCLRAFLRCVLHREGDCATASCKGFSSDTVQLGCAAGSCRGFRGDTARRAVRHQCRLLWRVISRGRESSGLSTRRLRTALDTILPTDVPLPHVPSSCHPNSRERWSCQRVGLLHQRVAAVCLPTITAPVVSHPQPTMPAGRRHFGRHSAGDLACGHDPAGLCTGSQVVTRPPGTRRTRCSVGTHDLGGTSIGMIKACRSNFEYSPLNRRPQNQWQPQWQQQRRKPQQWMVPRRRPQNQPRRKPHQRHPKSP